jgi:hypothetical protein
MTMDNVIFLNSDYSQGYKCAKEEVASGEIYCIESSLMLFAQDPADNDFQRGFEKGLKSLIKKENKNGL